MARLAGRGVVAMTGRDALKLLDNVVTNDLGLLERAPAAQAALLTPQGKILFTFAVVRNPDGLLLETSGGQAAGLVKRLLIYKLRADVAIADVSGRFQVHAAWGDDPPTPVAGAIVYPDPRHVGLGWRMLSPIDSVAAGVEPPGMASAYDALRVGLGVPEAGRDFPLGDTFPHEALLDRQAGVSFTKGCYVGQEVVARMQHKTVVRKRVVRLEAERALVASAEGAPVRMGEVDIGRVGTIAGRSALALIKLDRAAEAAARGETLTVGDVPVAVRPDDLGAFLAETAARQRG
jgi:folate-binding protein YgfZ